MSDELFDVAFSGQISAGANLQEVKARVGKMFNADGAKLEQLFSGHRLVIKKNVDQPTAQKYKGALRSVGAECEVTPTAVAQTPAPVPPEPNVEPQPATAVRSTPAAMQVAPTTPATTSEPLAAAEMLAPRTDPLGITADQIEDLAATLAPPGTELQSEVPAIPEPQYDLSAYEMAPVGDTLSSAEKAAVPPPPDTSGLSMAD